MAHYLLVYDFAEDYLERRGGFRDAHLALAREVADRGELVVGGAVDDPLDTGMLLFVGEDAAAAEAFARNDPYVANGIVTSWRVRRWRTVVGGIAEDPVPA